MSQETIGKVVRLFAKVDGILRKYPSETKVIIAMLFCIWATNFFPIMIKYNKDHPGTAPVQVQEAGRRIVKARFSNPNSVQALKWAKENGIATYKDEPPAWEKEGWHNWSNRILDWLLLIYLRCLPLVILFYLYQMAKRKGSLVTILANKFRLVLAIIFWPIMIFRYPYNVVREIVAEAELRRMGNAFHELSKSERELVRRIAENDRRQFQNWRMDFRLTHVGNFKRGFALALLVTIVVMLIAPVARSAPVGANGRLPIQITCANAPPGSVHLVQYDQSDQQANSTSAILAPETLLVTPIALLFVIQTVCERLIRGPVRTTFHIPISLRLSY